MGDQGDWRTRGDAQRRDNAIGAGLHSSQHGSEIYLEEWRCQRRVQNERVPLHDVPPKGRSHFQSHPVETSQVLIRANRPSRLTDRSLFKICYLAYRSTFSFNSIFCHLLNSCNLNIIMAGLN